MLEISTAKIYCFTEMTKYLVEKNASFYSFTLDFNKIRFSLKKRITLGVIGFVYSALYIKRSILNLFTDAENIRCSRMHFLNSYEISQGCFEDKR